MRALVSLAVLLLAMGPAWGQGLDVRCMPRDVAIEGLQDQFDEQPIARGIMPESGNMAEIFSTPDGKTWTFVITIAGPHPKSCFLASGEDWTGVEWRAPPKGDAL